jgi:hypothetical protein
VLRSIGGSIVFIYGDRWDLKQMMQKEDSGFFTGKRGTRLERGILRKAFEIGATVVLNDLTHTLRHGDVAVFRPDLWPEGGSPFLLIEAKSGRGGDDGRTARQTAPAKESFSYLSTDRKAEDHRHKLAGWSTLYARRGNSGAEGYWKQRDRALG